MNATVTCEYDVRGATAKNRKSSTTGELQHNMDIEGPLEDVEIYKDLLERAFAHFWTFEGEKLCQTPLRDLSITLKKINLEYAD
jgi:hypothetical protein